jgi:hypothetical protein
MRASFTDANYGGSVVTTMAPLRSTPGARVLGTTTDNQPILVAKQLGRGVSYSYGFWLGNYYTAGLRRGTAGVKLMEGYNSERRKTVTAIPDLLQIDRPVDVDVEMVEAARLDSSAGIAVTLFNWTNQPKSQVRVSIHNVPASIKSVASVEKGALKFTRNGSDITVVLPLADVDVLKLKK